MTIAELKDGALLRPDQVATLFGVTRQTVYNWINKGKLLAVVVAGHSIRIKKEDAVACMADLEE
jgi:excisionase family DNA binding protein